MSRRPVAVPENGASIKLRVFGPSLRSVLDVATIDGQQHQTLTRPRNVRWGEKFTLKYSGEAGPLQVWRGLSMGGGTIPNLQFNRALPSTTPPPGTRNLALSVMARNGMVRA